MCAAGAPPPDAAEGWVKYVDPSSGYAYYHNPVTGESVWAEGEASSGEEVGSGSPLSGAADEEPFESVWSSTKKSDVVDPGYLDVRVEEAGASNDVAGDGLEETGEEDDSDAAASTDDEDDDDDDDDESDDDDTSSESSDEERFEDELEDKFSAMLATPEGQAALAAEKTRADRLLARQQEDSYEEWYKKYKGKPPPKSVRFDEPGTPRSLALASISLITLPVRVPMAIGTAFAGWVVGLFSRRPLPATAPPSRLSDVV